MGKKEKTPKKADLLRVSQEKKKTSLLNIIIYILLRLIFILAGIVSVSNADYLTALQCFLALFIFILPAIIDKKFNIDIPNALEISIIIFTFMTVLGGELGHFYAQYPLWDKMTHTFSGFMIAAIGVALIDLLNKRKIAVSNLSPFFMVFFAFCFALTVGVMWEFLEFAVDKFSGATDMQADYFVSSFASKIAGGPKNPTPVIVKNIENVVINFKDGREALVLPGYIDIGNKDTMYDLMVGSIGAFAFCLVEFIVVTKKKVRMQKIADSYLIKKRMDETEDAANVLEKMALDDIHLKVKELCNSENKNAEKDNRSDNKKIYAKRIKKNKIKQPFGYFPTAVLYWCF